jgi:hypothetical protein
MTARQLDRAAARLDGLRNQRRSRLAVGAAAAAAAAIALIVSNALAISVGIGVAAMVTLAVSDTFRRRELLARLALNPNAYVVPDVKRYGDRLTVPRGRRRLAKALERVIIHAGTPYSYCIGDRVHKFRRELETLAALLRSPETRVEPTSVAHCWRLLTRAAESPLYNWELPADELGFQVRQIQLGIRRSSGATD